MPSDSLLFVYGSLMRGFQYNELLSDAEFVARTRTEPGWTLLDLGRYPGVIAGSQRIEGELYRLPDTMLAGLDRLEGCPELYRRVTTSLEDAREAFIYVLQPATVPVEPIVVECASWREWRSTQG